MNNDLVSTINEKYRGKRLKETALAHVREAGIDTNRFVYFTPSFDADEAFAFAMGRGQNARFGQASEARKPLQLYIGDQFMNLLSRMTPTTLIDASMLEKGWKARKTNTKCWARDTDVHGGLDFVLKSPPDSITPHRHETTIDAAFLVQETPLILESGNTKHRAESLFSETPWKKRTRALNLVYESRGKRPKRLMIYSRSMIASLLGDETSREQLLARMKYNKGLYFLLHPWNLTQLDTHGSELVAKYQDKKSEDCIVEICLRGGVNERMKKWQSHLQDLYEEFRTQSPVYLAQYNPDPIRDPVARDVYIEAMSPLLRAIRNQNSWGAFEYTEFLMPVKRILGLIEQKVREEDQAFAVARVLRLPEFISALPVDVAEDERFPMQLPHKRLGYLEGHLNRYDPYGRKSFAKHWDEFEGWARMANRPKDIMEYGTRLPGSYDGSNRVRGKKVAQ
ncbi:MAG: hypothetical protein QF486_02285 [Candidatus Woesearchaeota archaeon]|jgi:hypothetical protein|nr:hypothetical protein [Candidatus Woesearchaeota archaeon]MDP7198422.1 hypothetical protein [Candidatus Woesearchaeota archaeon]MDP7467523.1 hypothetical protein [Candidatus Woesearchaeota archaeon]MDP7646560.1 hypothetical protein [Candidatus Woesearchaeota archaeon]